jgi:folate-binding protein YgfZ
MSIRPELQAKYEAAIQNCAWFDLSDRTKIEITGVDRAAFLHNFCTNDIKNLPVGRGVEAFLCDGRGKILAYTRVFAMPDALWIDAAPQLGAKIVQHLARYVISEDVTLMDRTAAYCQRVICGPSSEARLGIQGMKLRPMDVGRFELLALDVRRSDELTVPCFQVLYPQDGRVMAMPCERASRDCYEILRVEAGTPEYGQDIDESNYPQEVGRTDRTVSFTKGCYLGQEPIVMIRDRGQIQRQLVGLRLVGSTPAVHGAKLWRESKDVGHITSSVFSPRLGSAIALGYVNRVAQEPGTILEFEMADGTRGSAAITKLPFA